MQAKHWAKDAPPRRPNFIPQTPNYLRYNWKADKDPDLDFVIGLIGESGLSPEDIEEETASLGHKVSRYTIMRWLYKDPHFALNRTLTIVALACGYSKEWMPRGDGRRASERKTFIERVVGR